MNLVKNLNHLRVVLATTAGGLLAAVGLVVVVVYAQPAEAAFPGQNGKIAFSSDRDGNFEIYVMSADGSNAKRISFGEGSYSQPAWSPRGDYIAFTKRAKGGFAIGIMKPDGSGERILTEGFHNESPTWAPNGQYIVFFRDPGGQAGGKLYMVDITGRVEQPVPTPSFASDPTWSPLLTEVR